MIDQAFNNVAHEVSRLLAGTGTSVSFELRRDADVFSVRVSAWKSKNGWREDVKIVEEQFSVSDVLAKKVPWVDSVGAKLCGMLGDLQRAMVVADPR